MIEPRDPRRGFGFRQLGWVAGGAVGSGVGLLLPGGFSAARIAVLVAHAPLAIALAWLALGAIRAHLLLRVKRPTWRSWSWVEGSIVGALGLATVATGMGLLVSALGVARVPIHRLHGRIGIALVVVALAHGARVIRRYPESMGGFGWGVARAAVAATTALGLALLPAGESRRLEVVAGGASAPFDGDVTPSPFARVDVAGCGRTECHAEITAEHLRSAHAVSPQTRYFAAILDALQREAPEKTGFCGGCHFAATADGRPTPGEGGLHCLVCHAAVGVHRVGAFGSTIALEQSTAHLAILNGAALEVHRAPDSRWGGWNLALLRAAGPAHGRALDTDRLARPNDLCLACHGLYIEEPAVSRFAPQRCVDCHMRGQADLSRAIRYAERAVAPQGGHVPHLFLGGNYSLFASLGDERMAGSVERWLTGKLRFSEQIAFWSFGAAERPENTAAWFAMRIEPQEEPVPGQDWVVDVATANVGVGHAFPSAPMDLVSITLSGQLRSKGGATLWSLAPDRITLGPRLIDDRSGDVLRGHRLWLDHSLVGEMPIERGETSSRRLSVPLPSDSDLYPLELSFQWSYRDLDPAFLAFAGEAAPAPDAIPIARSRAEVPYHAAPRRAAQP